MSHYEEEIREILSTKLRPDKGIILGHRGPTVIYGAGNIGRVVLCLLKKHGIRVGCFLDQKAGANISVDDVPVIRPDDPCVDKTAKVIVAVFNQTADTVSILSFLQQLGFTNPLPYTKLFMHFHDELPHRYWLGPPDIYEPYISDIAEALSMFEDRPSQELFTSFLRFRVTGDPAYMPQPQIDGAYFAADVPGMRKPRHFIDCGAFDGDTLMAFRKRFGMLESVRAFEPNPSNYQKLVNASREVPFSKDTVLFPCGVWSSTIQLNCVFDGISSYVSGQGDRQIQCVALDDCLNGYEPILMKMDIEGSELEALKGCRKLLTSKKPDLAIATYHAPEHLWKVPLLVKEMTPGYRYYLRSHGFNGYETFLYARYDRRSKS